MALVEMVKGLLTSAETIQVTKDMVVKLGKEPVVIKDAPGFATTRLGVALYLEASRMLEEGVASCADIDKAMKLGYGHRMGPFETCDLVGLDARLNNINALWESPATRSGSRRSCFAASSMPGSWARSRAPRAAIISTSGSNSLFASSP